MANIAAHTNNGHNYPGFVSINESPEGVEISVRGEAEKHAISGNYWPGETVGLKISHAAFAALVKQINENYKYREPADPAQTDLSL